MLLQNLAKTRYLIRHIKLAMAFESGVCLVRNAASLCSTLAFGTEQVSYFWHFYSFTTLPNCLYFLSPIMHFIFFFCFRCFRDSRSSRSKSNPPPSRRRPQRSSSSQESILMLWRSSKSRGRRQFTPHSSRPRPQNPSRHSLLLPTQPQVSLSPTSPPRNNPLWASLMLMNPPQDRWVKTGPLQIKLLRSQEQCNLPFLSCLLLFFKFYLWTLCRSWCSLTVFLIDPWMKDI